MTNDPEPLAVTIDRVVTLSEGIIAIAMTLLVLNIKVPDLNHAGPGALAHQIGKQGASYLAYGWRSGSPRSTGGPITG